MAVSGAVDVVEIAGHRAVTGSEAHRLLQQAGDIFDTAPAWRAYANHCVSDATKMVGYLGPVESSAPVPSPDTTPTKTPTPRPS